MQRSVERYHRVYQAGVVGRGRSKTNALGYTDEQRQAPVANHGEHPNLVAQPEDAMTNMLEGGCACGRLRYRMRSAPMFVHCCHCKDCQRQTGTGFVLNALIEADRIELLAGEPRPYAMPTDSGRPHRVFRCADCGTAAWSEYGGLTTLRFVRVGTLDDPQALPPDVHIYVRSKLPWITLPKDVPAFDAYYDSRALWPAASLERRKAVLG
jgi:hypothetical protein